MKRLIMVMCTAAALIVLAQSARPALAGINLSEGFESGTLGAFHSAVPLCATGGCGWTASASASHTGSYSAYAPETDASSDQQLIADFPVTIPGNGATLTFWHEYSFEVGFYTYDGGVLELSSDNGVTWRDAGPYVTTNGYNGTIPDLNYGNPLQGRAAWTGDSNGWQQTIVNLSSFTGRRLLFRFRLGSDDSVPSEGWHIDDIQFTTGKK